MKLKIKFLSLVRFSWKKRTKRSRRKCSKRSLKANSSSIKSEDIGRSFRSCSDVPVPKPEGKNQNRISRGGRSKGYSGHMIYQQHFMNDKRNEGKNYVIKKIVMGGEPRSK